MTQSRSEAKIDGEVSSFDEGVGLGSIVTSDDVKYRFHCVEIADGSRTIDVGARVTFEMLAKFGRYEATNIASR